MLHDDLQCTLLTEKDIKTRVAELAAMMDADCAGAEKPPLMIGVLKGSFMFIADLMRALKMDCAVDFMAVSSYGAKSETSGQVRILKDIGENIEGRDVIVIEDILDSGITLSYILELLKTRKPNSIRLCTLLDKPERRKAHVEVQYKGFTIPDHFVVGYGLDFAEKYRGLPYIGVLKPSVYS
jgi:hypoxanthine phosphoribosyltransferase